MKCSECGADIFEGIAKCPFCKTPTDLIKNDKFKNFDFTYTITSKEQIDIIRETVSQVSEETQKTHPDKKPGKHIKSGRAVLKLKKRSKAKRSGERGGNAVQVPARPLRKPGKGRAFDKRLPAFFAAAAVCLILIICGIFAVIGAVSESSSTANVYTYFKDNSVFLVYNGKTAELTKQAISADYLRHADEDAGLPGGTEAAKDAVLAVSTKTGTRTYYFENYNPENESGELKVIKNGKVKSIRTVSEAVRNSFLISPDGNALLYLQSTDKNGDMGALYYWKDGMDEPFKLASDIDSGTFAFSETADEALFLQNLDRTVMRGDLYRHNLKKLKEEKTLIDSDVCAIFGTGGKTKNYIYAKGYDVAQKSFDVYAYTGKDGEKQVRLGEKTKYPPVIIGRKNKNRLYIYGMSEGETCNLYAVDIKSGEKERIAAGVNRILSISADGKKILYDRLYDGKLADYYLYEQGSRPIKIAGNVSVDFDVVGRAPQLAISRDFSYVAYVSGFDAQKGGGTLCSSRIRGGNAEDAKQLASDVHSCYLTENNRIIFTKDYSTSRRVFDVYVQNGGKQLLLKDEISPEMFGVSQNGNNIFYISGYNVTGSYGSLERCDLKGKHEVISGDVFDFVLAADDSVLLCKNLNTENGTFNLSAAKPKKYSEQTVDSSVGCILTH